MFSVFTTTSRCSLILPLKEDKALEIKPAFSPAKLGVKFPDVANLNIADATLLYPSSPPLFGRGDHLALDNSPALALPASENVLLAN